MHEEMILIITAAKWGFLKSLMTTQKLSNAKAYMDIIFLNRCFDVATLAQHDEIQSTKIIIIVIALQFFFTVYVFLKNPHSHVGRHFVVLWWQSSPLSRRFATRV